MRLNSYFISTSFTYSESDSRQYFKFVYKTKFPVMGFSTCGVFHCVNSYNVADFAPFGLEVFQIRDAHLL